MARSVLELQIQAKLDAIKARDRYREALESIRRMTEELADSKYSKAAGGDTLGAEIHRITTEALSC